jgi:hypothetical protein
MPACSLIPLLMLLAPSPVEQAPVYRGSIRLPTAFVMPDGRLEASRYLMEVSRTGGVYLLTFMQDGEKKLSLTGHVRGAREEPPPARIPIIGAQFLRSSLDPLPTGQERQFSKTGAAQYEEEERDWKGVIRVYKSAQGSDAWFVFQERTDKGTWNTVDFKAAVVTN